MKIIGRIEKIANQTSIVVESRGVSGRLELHGQFKELADGQAVYLDISAQPEDSPVQHLSRTYAPLFQPYIGGPILAEELQDERRKQRIKAAVAEALDS